MNFCGVASSVFVAFVFLSPLIAWLGRGLAVGQLDRFGNLAT